MSALAIIRVPKVWRRSWKRSGRNPAPLGRVVAPAERRAVDVAAELADEDKVVVLSRGPALPELGQGRRDPERHRHRSDLAALRRGQGAVGVTRANAERLAGEVDIAPVECEQFA